MKQFSVISVLLLVALLVGCIDGDPPTPSPVVPTSDMYTEIHAFSTDGGTIYTEAYIKRGGPTTTDYVRLEDGDELYVSKNKSYSDLSLTSDNFFADVSRATDEHHRMQEVSHSSETAFGIPFFSFLRFSLTSYGELGTRYIANATGFDPGTDVVVSFMRPTRLDAPNSRVTLPADFEITEPIQGQSAIYSRSLEDIVIRWSPSGSALVPSFFLVANCDTGDVGTWEPSLASDSGELIIPAGSLSGVSGNCILRISVTRSQLGLVDPAFGWGGIIKAHQIRFANVTTTD